MGLDAMTTVPPIYTPFTPAIHPRHPVIDEQVAHWAESFGIGSAELRGKLVRHDIGTFAARILPEGREEVIQVLADFVLWLFGVDDGLCEESELGTRPGDLLGELFRLLRVAQDPEAGLLPGDPLAQGLRDLRRRIDRWATPGQTARWVDALREYCLAVVWEASYRAEGRVPTLADYTLMRLYDGATTVVLPLLEMGYGYELQSHERDRKAVRAVAEMASFVIAWDNDIFSHHKESRGGDYYLNVVRVLEQEHGLSHDEALAKAIGQRDRVMTLLLRVRDGLLEDASPQLRLYLESLGHYIRGAQDWGVTSTRYTTPHDPAGLPTVFADSPTDAGTAPLDIAPIRWWWDCDGLPQPRVPSL